MRRVVTGHRNGKSVILDDAEIAGQGTFGSEMFGLWGTDEMPTIPLENLDYKKQLTMGMPKPGGTAIALWVRPPDEEFFKKAKENGVDIAELWHKRFGDKTGMHTTDTIDYIIILSGEMWLELDGGVLVHLKPGDCVVQNGIRHAWRNKGSENCVMAIVMIRAKRR